MAFIAEEALQWIFWWDSEKDAILINLNAGDLIKERAREFGISEDDLLAFLATCWRRSYISVSFSMELYG